MKKYTSYTGNQMKAALEAGDKIESEDDFSEDLRTFIFEDIREEAITRARNTKAVSANMEKAIMSNVKSLILDEKFKALSSKKFMCLVANAIISKRFSVVIFMASKEDKRLSKMIDDSINSPSIAKKVQLENSDLIKIIRRDVLEMLTINISDLKKYLGEDSISMIS